VISITFVASRVDGGRFVLHDKNQNIFVTVVVLYIDDLLIINVCNGSGLSLEVQVRFGMNPVPIWHSRSSINPSR
jgi:hypothetical protein